MNQLIQNQRMRYVKMDSPISYAEHKMGKGYDLKDYYKPGNTPYIPYFNRNEFAQVQKQQKPGSMYLHDKLKKSKKVQLQNSNNELEGEGIKNVLKKVKPYAKVATSKALDIGVPLGTAALANVVLDPLGVPPPVSTIASKIVSAPLRLGVKKLTGLGKQTYGEQLVNKIIKLATTPRKRGGNLQNEVTKLIMQALESGVTITAKGLKDLIFNQTGDHVLAQGIYEMVKQILKRRSNISDANFPIENRGGAYGFLPDGTQYQYEEIYQPEIEPKSFFEDLLDKYGLIVIKLLLELFVGKKLKKGGIISIEEIKKKTNAQAKVYINKLIKQSEKNKELKQFLIEKMLEVQQLLQKKGGCSGCSKSVKQYKGLGRSGGARSGGVRSGGVKSGGQKIDKRKIRGDVVKKLMAQGMTFGQASKKATNYIKQHNLY